MTADCASKVTRGAGTALVAENHHLTRHSWGCALTNRAPTFRLCEQWPGGDADVPDRAVMSMVRTGHTSPGLYEIRVHGRLEPRWSTWFDGFTLTPEADGTTVISGTVIDQAALHGLLQSLRDLGLPLVSVTQPQEEGADPLADGDHETGSTRPRPTIPAQEEPR